MMPNLLDNTSRSTAVITKVLSQYELLQSICTNLSSADIIHLAATCKEHRTYITSSKEVFAHLQSTARCDGRGVVAQARVFGYWDGDPTNAPANSQCLDTDVKPCTSCGAHVCDNCRFHFIYYLHDRTWEPFFAEDVEEEGFRSFARKLPDLTIESRKAFDMYWNYSRRTFCDACEPLIIGLENRFQTCHCDFYDYFVGSRWLCLPCFFVEEVKSYSIKLRKITTFKAGQLSGYHRNGYFGVDLCDCGKQSRYKSIECCRRCGGVTGMYRCRKDEVLQKIHAQLG